MNKKLSVISIIILALSLLPNAAPALAQGGGLAYSTYTNTNNGQPYTVVASQNTLCVPSGETIVCDFTRTVTDNNQYVTGDIFFNIKFTTTSNNLPLYVQVCITSDSPLGTVRTEYDNGSTIFTTLSELTSVETTTTSGANSINQTQVLQVKNTAISPAFQGTYTLSAKVTVSTVPITEPCNSNLCGGAQYVPASIAVDKQVLDPKVEPGIGDEQARYDLLQHGDQVILTVSQGTWNDGTNNRSNIPVDVELSTDGTTWHTLASYGTAFAECYDTFPNQVTIIFTPPNPNIWVRVADSPGQFADNTEVQQITWTLGIVYESGGRYCGNQFMFSIGTDLIASGEVEGLAFNGYRLADNLTIGDYYVLASNGGPWQDADQGPSYLLDVRSKFVYWYDIKENGLWPAQICYEQRENYFYAFFQANSKELYLQVNDPDGNWLDNSGSVGVKLYRVSYSPNETTCQTKFKDEELIDSKVIPALADLGVAVNTVDNDLLPTDLEGGGSIAKFIRHYKVEIVDGPWFDNGEPSYDVEISDDNGVTWTLLQDYDSARCAIKYDTGRYRVYISTQDRVHKPFKLRVRNLDGGWGNNTGEIRYNWYQATSYDIYEDPDEFPETGGPKPAGYCDTYYQTETSASATLTVAANAISGYTLPGLTAGARYALEITSGSWKDDGADPSRYDLSISDNGGGTWYPLLEYPGIQCGDTPNTNYVRVYFTAGQGARYKVRVNDTGSNWGANTGSLDVDIYPETAESASSPPNPWNTCADDYGDLRIVVNTDNDKLLLGVGNAVILSAKILAANGQLLASLAGSYLGNAILGTVSSAVPTNTPNGIVIEYQLVAGAPYAIQFYGDAWYDNLLGTGDAQYGMQGSWDNGTTWHPMVELPGVTCAISAAAAGTGWMRYYFSAQTTSLRLRVDDDDFYTNKSGKVDYLVAQALEAEIYSPTTAAAWAAGCTIAPSAPANWLDIGGWINYGQANVLWFLSFCPEHVQAIAGIPGLFFSREPFGFIGDFVGLGHTIQSESENYTWGTTTTPGEQLGASGGDDSVDMLPTVTDNSFWMGGGLDLSQPTGGAWDDLQNEIAMRTVCEDALATRLGPKLGEGFCYITNFVRQKTDFDETLQFMLEAGAVMWFLFYIQKRWHVIGY